MECFMTRTIITPEHTRVSLSIPADYIGTKLEVLIFPVDDVVSKTDSIDLQERAKRIPAFGCLKGQIIMADDFDAPLEDFKEYM
jgi:hypothetical protein